MTKCFVFNDLHLGVLRGAGTTPTTQFALRNKLLTEFGELLALSGDSDVMILGDLFDSSSIPMYDWLSAFNSLCKKLQTGGTLYLVDGNHDVSKTSSTLSSFWLLASVLKQMYAEKVIHISGSAMTPYGYVVSHVRNQDLFDQELSRVPACGIAYFHANYDNNFAAESDQSLNLSATVAAALPVDHIIIAHEHQTRKIGKVYLPGCQLASSVSDCLGTDAKRYVVVEDGVPRMEKLTEVDTLLARMDWTQLEPTDRPFIRVQGEATSDQAAAVVAAIARYRNTSPALVVTNAVKIGNDTVGETFASNLESVKAFDVMATLKEILTAEEFAVVESVR